MSQAGCVVGIVSFQFAHTPSPFLLAHRAIKLHGGLRRRGFVELHWAHWYSRWIRRAANRARDYKPPNENTAVIKLRIRCTACCFLSQTSTDLLCFMFLLCDSNRNYIASVSPAEGYKCATAARKQGFSRSDCCWALQTAVVNAESQRLAVASLWISRASATVKCR